MKIKIPKDSFRETLYENRKKGSVIWSCLGALGCFIASIIKTFEGEYMFATLFLCLGGWLCTLLFSTLIIIRLEDPRNKKQDQK